MSYSYRYSTSSPREALLIGLLIGYLCIVIASLVLIIIGRWKIFRKAGYHPAKMLIPGYGIYLDYKIARCLPLFWTYIGITAGFDFLSLVMSAMMENAMVEYGISYGTYGAISVMMVGVLLIAVGVMNIIYCVKLARAFGKSGGFAFGLIVLPPIFMMILGCGSAQYRSENEAALPVAPWKCSCGAENNAGAIYCANCGNQKNAD